MKEGKDLKTGCELFHIYLQAILNNAISIHAETMDQYLSAYDYRDRKALKESLTYYQGRINTLSKILEQYRSIVIGE